MNGIGKFSIAGALTCAAMHNPKRYANHKVQNAVRNTNVFCFVFESIHSVCSHQDAKKPARLNGKPASTAPAANVAPLLVRLQEERALGISGGIYHKVQVELTYNSNHMEGSRLTRDQTRLIFETATVGVEGEALRVDDVIETANHFRCVEYVVDHALDPLSERLVKKLHGMLKASTTDARKDWYVVGDYKLLPNEAGGRSTAAPQDDASAVRGIIAAYEVAPSHALDEIVALHVAFERIHPFQDGNGRVGRLIMFKECLRNAVSLRHLGRYEATLLSWARAMEQREGLAYGHLPYGPGHL